jgi:nitrous oxide reductase
VVLEILGVNGAIHPAVIEGYDIEFAVKRGQLTTVEFIADKPGVFQIFCSANQPAMTGTLMVLPADSA